ncbi:conserved Plasmodium protein, unknown function [Plasmodium ovale]|uniref:CCZ1/INTU/HSP4 first Longin domain-containing protein n=1 Tax=Plasmodium ovale TaxID=36330 RepID=A0A1C3KS42_PLAOA|nr:conserved Plasmodium protein, unknown function [Plasmodium ovale]
MDKIKIEALFIYDEDVKKNDKFVTDEQIQAEKVLYYYPQEADPNAKVSHASTMEGVSAFINHFSKSHIDHIVTNNNLIVLNRWYKRLFVTVIVKNLYTSYNMELLMCKLLHSVLSNFISIFTLLHGHIRNYLKYKKYKTTESVNKKKGLQTILDDYVFTYINTINNENISIHNELQSFHFFPVEKHTYVTVQNLISSLILGNKSVKNGALFYEGYLIYSSLPISEMKIIYNYLVSYSGTANGGLSSFGRCNSIEEKNGFLLGIKKSSVFMPVITLRGDKKHKLVALIFKGILMLLLIKGSTVKDEDFDILLDVQNKCTNENTNDIYNLYKLNESLQHQFKKYINQDDVIKFFYYNECNNSVKYSCNNKKINNEEIFLVTDFHYLLKDSEIRYNQVKFNKSMCLKNKEKETLSKEFFNFQHHVQTTAAGAATGAATAATTAATGVTSIPSRERGEEKAEEHQGEGIKGFHSKVVHETVMHKSVLGNSFSQEGKDVPRNFQDAIYDAGRESPRIFQREREKMAKIVQAETSKGTVAKETGGNTSVISTHSTIHTQAEEKTRKMYKGHIADNAHLVPEQDKQNRQNEWVVEGRKSRNLDSARGTNGGRKKVKLVFNDELKKKLFEDTSDDVKIETVFFKEANSPWVVGKRSLQRELFLFPDDVKMSLSKAQHDFNQLIDTHFANIYI